MISGDEKGVFERKVPLGMITLKGIVLVPSFAICISSDLIATPPVHGSQLFEDT